MVTASGRKNAPGTPPSRPSGSSTATGVSVEPSSAWVISPTEAGSAAAPRWPPARWRWKFSTTTMASSRIRPMPAAMPPSVMRLKLMSEAAQRHAGDEHRGRDDRRRHRSGAHIGDEEEDRRDGQQQADADAVAHAADGLAHQVGLIVEDRRSGSRGARAASAARRARTPASRSSRRCRRLARDADRAPRVSPLAAARVKSSRRLGSMPRDVARGDRCRRRPGPPRRPAGAAVRCPGRAPR